MERRSGQSVEMAYVAPASHQFTPRLESGIAAFVLLVFVFALAKIYGLPLKQRMNGPARHTAWAKPFSLRSLMSQWRCIGQC
jgi:hypothetical protein